MLWGWSIGRKWKNFTVGSQVKLGPVIRDAMGGSVEIAVWKVVWKNKLIKNAYTCQSGFIWERFKMESAV